MAHTIPSNLLLQHIGWHPQIRTVLLSGGVHGDEMTGIELLKEWEEHPTLVERQGIEVTRLLSNPGAVGSCMHYLDDDMNDFFSMAELLGPSRGSRERARAQEIFKGLGGRKGCIDLAVDFHNTSANMGVTLIVSRLNPFVTRLVSSLYLRYPSFVHILYTPEEHMSSPYLDSLGLSGLTVEAGPLKHGPYLDLEMYGRVRQLASDIMDFCAAWNAGTAPLGKSKVPVFSFLQDVHYVDVNKDGLMEKDLNPLLLGKDFQPLSPGTPLLSQGVGAPVLWKGPGLAYPYFVGETTYRRMAEGQLAMSLSTLSFENW